MLLVVSVLLKKGSRISNVLLSLYAGASTRIPLLFFEIFSLGPTFTFTRFGLNTFIVFLIAFVIEKMLTEYDEINLC